MVSYAAIAHLDRDYSGRWRYEPTHRVPPHMDRPSPDCMRCCCRQWITKKAILTPVGDPAAQSWPRVLTAARRGWPVNFKSTIKGHTWAYTHEYTHVLFFYEELCAPLTREEMWLFFFLFSPSQFPFVAFFLFNLTLLGFLPIIVCSLYTAGRGPFLSTSTNSKIKRPRRCRHRDPLDFANLT